MPKYNHFCNQLNQEKLTLGKSIQKFFCKLLISSTLIGLEIGYDSGISFAGTATINASYDVKLECNFTSQTYSNATPRLLRSNNIVSGILWDGTLGISCNHGGKVLVYTSAPIVSSAVTSLRNLSSYYGEALYIYDNVSVSGYIWKNGNYTAVPSVVLTPGSNILYQIYMSTSPSTSGPILPNGNYSYSFTLTAIPN